MTPTVQIHCGHAAAVMATFPADSIPIVVTSPPYDSLREGAYAGFTWDDFRRVADELYRVICDGGVVCWNVNDAVVDGSETLTAFKQAIYFKECAGFRVHDTMIYEKLNFSHPERARYHQVFEYVFILSKGTPGCFNPIKDKKNATAGCIGNLGVNTFTERDGSKSVREKKLTAEFGMRHNIWRGKTRGQEDMCEELPHSAMMPKWLARDLILSFSNPGNTVLDPMCGSGTTLVEAIKYGRNAVGIDINPDYTVLTKASTHVTPGFALA